MTSSFSSLSPRGFGGPTSTVSSHLNSSLSLLRSYPTYFPWFLFQIEFATQTCGAWLKITPTTTTIFHEWIRAMKCTECFEVVQKTKHHKAEQEPSHDAHGLVQSPVYGVAFPTKVLVLVVFRSTSSSRSWSLQFLDSALEWVGFLALSIMQDDHEHPGGGSLNCMFSTASSARMNSRPTIGKGEPAHVSFWHHS